VDLESTDSKREPDVIVKCAFFKYSWIEKGYFSKAVFGVLNGLSCTEASRNLS